jgi:hypothetical protein
MMVIPVIPFSMKPRPIGETRETVPEVQKMLEALINMGYSRICRFHQDLQTAGVIESLSLRQLSMADVETMWNRATSM